MVVFEQELFLDLIDLVTRRVIGEMSSDIDWRRTKAAEFQTVRCARKPKRGTADVVRDTEKFCRIIWRATGIWLLQDFERLCSYQLGGFNLAPHKAQPLALDQKRGFLFRFPVRLCRSCVSIDGRLCFKVAESLLPVMFSAPTTAK